MTETEWRSCSTKPALMVRRIASQLSPRKRQLLACAIARQIPGQALEPWEKKALQAAEEFAEGDLPAAEFHGIAESVRHACEDLEMRQAIHGDVPEEKISAATAILCACGTADVTRSIPALLEHVQRYDQLTAPRGLKSKSRNALLERQCGIVRDISCYPTGLYRRELSNAGISIAIGEEIVIVPESAKTLAKVIHAEQAFDRLPMLADALDDAGFQNAMILSHLRAADTHIRGCWVLDLLLGRG